MNKQEWLDKIEKHKNVLSELIAGYHPRSYHIPSTRSLPITAPGAEAVAEQVREQIKREKHTLPPVEEFDNAIKSGNVELLIILLDEAYFGVPESTECWNIPGFGLAVDLLEDTP